MEESKSGESQELNPAISFAVLSGILIISLIGMLYASTIVNAIQCQPGTICFLPSGVSDSDLGLYQGAAIISGLILVGASMGIVQVAKRNATLTLTSGCFALLLLIFYSMSLGLVPVR